MNLWVKRTGQLLLAALFLMSCEDDSFLLGFPNSNKKFNVYFQDFLVGDGTVLSIDSIVTDNSNSTGIKRILVGEHSDPILGNIRTEAFAQISPSGTKLAAEEDHTYVYDSIIVQLKLDEYCYGLGENFTLGKFNIYRVTEDFPYSESDTSVFPGTDHEVVYKKTKYYFNDSQVSYSSDLLGQTKFQIYSLKKDRKERRSTSINYDLLKSGVDTLIAAARLNDDFGMELFNVALNDADNEYSDIQKFRNRFKGLAIIPEGCNSILGIKLSNVFSNLKLYYHSTVAGESADTLSRELFFSGSSFTNIQADRINGLPTSDNPYVGVDPSDTRVVQAGCPIVTKIDLNKFYTEFADNQSDKSIVINSAQLLIESVSGSHEYAPLPQLNLRLMKEDDHYLNYKTTSTTERDSLNKFFVYQNGLYYNIINDNFILTNSITPAYLSYDSASQKYEGSLTIFTQKLYENKNSSYRIRYLGLYPSDIGKSVDRSVFLKNNIKLRVYYTIPIKSNL